MVKKIKGIVKLALPAGKANPTPPVGPALGQYGINILNFCKDYNNLTINHLGLIIPAKITIYEDKSYTFIIKSPVTSNLLLKYANTKKGSSKPNIEKNGIISKEQILEIAKLKLQDLNTTNISKAISIITGTAKSLGLIIT